MLQSETRSPFAAMAQVLRDTIRREGIRGLYRGYSTVFVFTMPVNAVYFTSYMPGSAMPQS